MQIYAQCSSACFARASVARLLNAVKLPSDIFRVCVTALQILVQLMLRSQWNSCQGRSWLRLFFWQHKGGG